MRISYCLMLAAALALCATAAGADPWPNWYAQTYTVDYVDVVPVFNSGTDTWTFQLSMDSGATDPTWGAIDPTYGGVKALVVYQLSSPLEPDDFAGLGANPTRPGWGINGGWETHPSGWGAFGWLGSTPTTYVHPGESDTTNFWGQWSGDVPAEEDFVYLVHVAVDSSDPAAQTFWARLGEPVIPEPASIVLLGLGGLGVVALRRRKS